MTINKALLALALGVALASLQKEDVSKDEDAAKNPSPEGKDSES